MFPHTEHGVEWSDVIVALKITKQAEDIVASDVVGKQLPSLSHWHRFYFAYARVLGFGVRNDKLRKDEDGVEWQRIWVCSREGYRRKRGEGSDNTMRKRVSRQITRIGCKAGLKVTLDRQSQQWVATGFTLEHNHELASSSELQFIRCFRDIPDVMVQQAKSMRKAGIRTMCIFDYLAQQSGGRCGLPFLKKDMYNRLAADRNLVGAETDSEGALGYLTALAIRDGAFYCRFNVDENDRLHTIFWADGTSRYDYRVFGEVLAFDTTYRRNAYNKPLLIFVGVNHHYRTTIFGVALLSDETTTTFNWVLNQFVDCMGGQPPKVVITDGDLGMRAAIKEVFPNALHRLCGWHLANNAASNVPNGEFKIQFSKLLYRYFSETEFEERWASVIEEHGLQHNGWASTTYAHRKSWAETFLRGHFVGGMRTTQRCESINSYMARFLDSKHLLRDFVSQVDQGIQNIRYNELQDDFTSKHTEPPIPVDHPLKCFYEQFAVIYTRNIFYEVVKEIDAHNLYTVSSTDYSLECTRFTLTRFRYGEIRSVVQYYPTTKCIKCTCLLLETDGIPCRHVFLVLKHLNIDRIPSCLFKDRWYKEAKGAQNTPRSGLSSTMDNSEVMRINTLASDFNHFALYASKYEDTFYRAREDVHKLTESLKQIFIDRQQNSPSITNNFNEDVAASNNIVRDPVRAKTKGREKENRKTRPSTQVDNHVPHRKRCKICNELGHNRATCNLRNTTRTKMLQTQADVDMFPSLDTLMDGQTFLSHQGKNWDFGASTSSNP